MIREIGRQFRGDCTFSVRNQFPDACYELHNPESVDPDRRMRVTLPLTTDDFPPHIQDHASTICRCSSSAPTRSATS